MPASNNARMMLRMRIPPVSASDADIATKEEQN
jgi:hypothetical protein